MTITPESIVLIAIFLLFGFPVHEFAHALVAWRLGDGTARMYGRLTLNPIVHFDPIGGLLLVISALSNSGFIFGWAKPTPVNPMNLRDRRNGEVLVAVAGPVSNLLMAIVAAIVFRAVGGVHSSLPDPVLIILYDFVAFNVALAIFNLIPIPPLDGSAILFRFLDPRTAYQIRPILAQYGILILLVVLVLPILPPGVSIGSKILIPILSAINSFLVGV